MIEYNIIYYNIINLMNKLYFDIIYLIFESLDFLSKIRLRSISKYMHTFEIHDFYNIEKKYY
jgi:hypothetical protein